MPTENASYVGDIVVPLLVGFIGAAISLTILYYQRKGFRETAKAEKQKVLLTGLAEAFRLLNDVKHREARKVLYGNASPSSYEIVGFNRPTPEGGATFEELKAVCKEIVKNDCNEIGVLAYYGLVDEEKFIEEGFWVILKVWDLLKDEIEIRRNRDSLHHMKHLQDLRTKACEYAEKNDPKVYREFCLGNGSKNGSPI